MLELTLGFHVFSHFNDFSKIVINLTNRNI